MSDLSPVTSSAEGKIKVSLGKKWGKRESNELWRQEWAWKSRDHNQNWTKRREGQSDIRFEFINRTKKKEKHKPRNKPTPLLSLRVSNSFRLISHMTLEGQELPQTFVRVSYQFGFYFDRSSVPKDICLCMTFLFHENGNWTFYLEASKTVTDESSIVDRKILAHDSQEQL